MRFLMGFFAEDAGNELIFLTIMDVNARAKLILFYFSKKSS